MRKSVAVLFILVFLTASSIIIAKPASSAETPENSWKTMAPIPETSRGIRAATANGKIYVMADSINYEYNPARNKWAEKTPMPTPRTYFQIAVYQNKIYTIGGRSGWDSETGSIYSGANEVYDPSTDTWETKKSMPTNRSAISASVVNGKIHLIGADIHEVYDVYSDSWTTRQEISFPLLAYGYSSVAFDDKIYLINWNQTQIYNPKSDSWSLGASPPINVSGSGVCATTGVMAPKRIYAIGGSRGLEGTDATQVYDPKTDTWTLGAPMPTARLGLTVAVVNDQIYSIGGSAMAAFSPVLTTMERYTPFGYGTPDPSYDGTPPEVTLISPENKTYHETSVLVEFSVNESVSWMRYELDNENITEISGNTTITGLSLGAHNLTVYAIDAAGNTGVSQTIHFEVEEPFPATLVIASVITAAVVTAGLFAYFKKRKR